MIMNTNQFNAIVLSYSPGPFEYDHDPEKPIDLEKLSVSVASRIRFAEDSDFVGLQLDIAVDEDNHNFLKTGFVAGLRIEGWSDFLRGGGDLRADRAPLVKACAKVWDMAIGIVASHTVFKGRGFILPPIAPQKIADDTILRKQPPVYKK